MVVNLLIPVPAQQQSESGLISVNDNKEFISIIFPQQYVCDEIHIVSYKDSLLNIRTVPTTVLVRPPISFLTFHHTFRVALFGEIRFIYHHLDVCGYGFWPVQKLT